MLDVQIRGAENLEQIGRRLKAAGDGGLRRELLAGIRKAARPLPAAVRTSALSTLPRRGDLAARVAASSMSTRTRLAGSSVGVRFDARGIYNLRRMDDGTVRHPVFGRMNAWVAQPIREGWFSKPAEEIAPEVREAVEQAMRDVAAKITD